MNNDDKWFAEFDKNFNKMFKVGKVIIAFFICLSILFLGLFCWGLIEIILWVTSK
jgi:hypothetical protein